MFSRFYENHSKTLLWIVVATFPILMVVAESLESDNDIETWLPETAPVRVSYDSFKERFGNEELIIIGLKGHDSAEPIVESVRGRMERLEGIRQCWSPESFREVMSELDVPDTEIDRRLDRLVISPDGEMIALVALLSEHGQQNREEIVADINAELAYCQLEESETVIAGAPIVVTELNRLGSRENTKVFFFVTLLISLLLLYFNIRQWNITLALLGVTIWGIELVLTSIYVSGHRMNFILSALPVMVMVFSLAISIHFVHYFRSCGFHSNPLQQALRLAWKPCALATLTTTIGLVSLGVSDIGPVREFGYFAGLGAIIAFICGLGLTPAVLTVFPPKERIEFSGSRPFDRFVHWMLDRRGRVAFSCIGVVLLAGLGLSSLSTRIDPLEFLPEQSKVRQDVHQIEEQLANTSSIEAIVDFGDSETPFIERLDEVRRIQQLIGDHPDVQTTMSLATFFPTEMPGNAFEAADLLSKAQGQREGNGYIAEGERYWRISARITSESEQESDRVLSELKSRTDELPVSYTGIAPLLQHAQGQIFHGFWESFATAFLIISLVMITSLRSIGVGLLAMIPNLTPICLVFGCLGWAGMPVDIGMMMTGSIALGIAVDGTFHYLVRYQEDMQECGDSAHAARIALLKTGQPIFTAAAVAAAGMMALTLSDFAPTAMFGYMMAAMLMAALVGDLVLLPVLLTLRKSRQRTTVVPHPHIHRKKVARQSQAGVAVMSAIGSNDCPGE